MTASGGRCPTMPSGTEKTLATATVSTPAIAEAHPGGVALLLSALGVVFGDIGTRPIYAFRETLRAAGVDAEAVATPTSTAFGVLSLIVWAVTLVVGPDPTFVSPGAK